MARFRRAFPGQPYIRQVPVVTTALQVRPFVARPPAPARARVGAGAVCAGGLGIPPDPPLLVASYPVYVAGGTGSAVTGSFTPAVGEILVVKGITEDASSIVQSTPTGGGFTYTLWVSDVTSSHTGCKIWTAPVTASASMTVTVAHTGNGANSIVVERWSGAQLATTPATVDTRGSGAPSTTITTVGASSVVSWLNGDWAAISGTPTYNSTSAVPTQDGYTTQSGLYTAYYAYQIATAPGSQTLGITSPTGQTWTLLGIEIENAGATSAPSPNYPHIGGPTWRRLNRHRQRISPPSPPIAAAAITLQQRPPGHRPPPPPRRATTGNQQTGAGIAAPPPAVPVAASARGFVSHRPAPARARVGPSGKTGGGVAALVNLPGPLPPAVQAAAPVHRFRPASPRAKVGPGTYVAAGQVGPSLSLGYLTQPPPRPVIVHRPPARAHTGPRGQAAGGVASAAPPLGSPSQPAPRPVIQHLPPRRVLWRGYAAPHYPAGAAPSPQLRPVITRRPPARAWVGPRPGPYGGVAGGVPLGTLLPARPFIARSRVPARAHVGPAVACAAGAARGAPPVVTAYQRPAPQIRRPAAAQVLWHGAAGPAPIALPGTPGAYQRVSPQIRRPGPARAKLGPSGAVGAGVAALVNLPGPLPPAAQTAAPVHRYRPAPARGLWHGTAVAAVPPAAPPVGLPPLTVKRPARARAVVGPASGCAAGIASTVVTPTGAAQPVIPIIIGQRRVSRAVTGPATSAAGIQGPAPLVVAYRIWPSTPGPATSSGDPSAYSLGVEFTLSVNATFAGIWFWRATAGDALPTSAELFQVTGPGTGTPVAGSAVTFPVTAATGWILAAATGPVTITAGVPYKAVVCQSAAVGWYSATTHYWDTGPGAAGITSGIIFAPDNAAADGGQDTFNLGGILTYPASSFNATNYWVDVAVLGPYIPPVPGTPGAYQRVSPQIRRPGPARAKLGPAGAVGAGTAGLYNLPLLGPPQVTVPVVPGRLPAPLTRVVWHGAGYPAQPPVVTAYQRPAPAIRRPAPARGLWHGVAAPAVPLGTLPVLHRPLPPQAQRPAPARAVWHGAAAPAPPVLPGTPGAYQRTPPQIRRPAPARATLGPRGTCAAGYTAPPVPLGALPPARKVPQYPPKHTRATTGHTTTAGGTTGPAPIPLATTYQRPAPQIRRPGPYRAVTGPRSTAAAGRGGVLTQFGALGPPKPFVWRSPLHASARIGPRGTAGAGIPVPHPPLGALGPPKPFIWRSPLPARGRCGPRGQAAGGSAGLYNKPVTAVPVRPFVWRPPLPARSRIGPRWQCAAGYASRVVTQLGAPQYAVPVVPGRRPPPLTRARFGGVHGLVNLKPLIVPGVTGGAVPQNVTGGAVPQNITGTATPG